jgi:hypothetical protein
MNQERILELWAKFLQGTSLSSEEEVALCDGFRNDERLRQEILKDLRVHGLLRSLEGDPLAEEAFQRRFFGRLAADSDESQFIRRVESQLPVERKDSPDDPASRVPRPKTRRRRSPPSTRRSVAGRPGASPGAWTWGLVAAGLFMGILVLLFFTSSESGQVEREKISRERRAPGKQSQPSGARAEDEGAKPRGETERIARPAEEAQAENERKRRELSRVRVRPGDPAAEEERTKVPPKPEDEKARREPGAVGRAEKNPEPPAPPPTPREEKPRPAPAAAPGTQVQEATQVVIAQVEESCGEVFLLTKAGKVPAMPGMNVLSAQGLETGTTGGSRLVLRFPDKTCIELGARTEVSEIKLAAGKKLLLDRGTVRAQVSKQPKAEPMLIATPHGEAKVVGTTLRIVVDPDPNKGTQLEVEEGKVELKNLAGKTVLVESGHVAVAATGVELVAKSLQINEILLFPWQARLVAAEWSLVPDSSAHGGTALYARKTSYQIKQVGTNSIYGSVKSRPSYVLFNFYADGGKDYWVWLRGKSLPEDPNHVTTAEVAVEVPGAQLNPLNAESGDRTLTADHAYDFTGFFRFPGYGWIGGAGEHPEQGKVDEVPLSIRFSRSGMQTLKLHALQAPAWIDAVWLSTTQSTRPQAGQAGN